MLLQKVVTMLKANRMMLQEMQKKLIVHQSLVDASVMQKKLIDIYRKLSITLLVAVVTMLKVKRIVELEMQKKLIVHQSLVGVNAMQKKLIGMLHMLKVNQAVATNSILLRGKMPAILNLSTFKFI
jgi:lipopolysaccharide/colanic/teichoic acid biosynthesis glycosyltransferase